MNETTAASDRRMIVVLGMHRSGTSAVAGTLSYLGVDFSEHLIAASADNPKGYFEHADIWRVDHEILEALGSQWDDVLPMPANWQRHATLDDARVKVRAILKRDFGSAELGGIKDPRMCRLLPPWRDWLVGEGFVPQAVLVIRRPAEVVASLAKRDRLSPEQSAWIWLRHVLEAESGTRGWARVIVRYEDLLGNWRTEAAHIAHTLDLVWPCDPDSAGASIDAFLEPALRHYCAHGNIDGLAGPLRNWLERTIDALAGDMVDTVALDRVAEEVARADQLAAAGATVLRLTRKHRDELETGLRWCDDERRKLVLGNAELREDLERHARELAAMRIGNADLRANLDRHVAALAAMRAGNAELQANLDRHIAELAATRAGNAELQANLDRHVEELARMHGGNAELQANLDRHVTELAATRAGNAELQANLDRHIEELARMHGGNAELQANLDRHVTELAATRAGNAELQSNLDRHIEELARMRSGNGELKANLDHHVAELAKLHASNAELRAELERQAAEMAATQGRYANLQTNLDRLGAELTTTRIGRADMQAKLEYQTMEWTKMRASYDELSEQNIQLGAENRTVRAELAQIDNERMRLADEREQLVAQRTGLSEQLAAIYASTSWRVTRPMRGVVRLGHRLRQTAAQLDMTGTGAASARSQMLLPPVPSATDTVTPVLASAADAAHADRRTATLLVEQPAASGMQPLIAPNSPRVLIVTPDIHGPIRNGGIGTAFGALARTLVGAGHAVTILYTLGGHSEDGGGIERWVHHYAALGIQFVPVWLEHGEPVLDAPHHAWRAYRVYLWLKQHQHDYDLAYFPEWKGEAYYALQSKRLGLDFARLRMIVVTHSSTTWAESGNYVVPQQFDDLLLEFLERRSTEMADAVISPSQYMVDWMHQRGWRWAAPTHVIQNLMPDAPMELPSGPAPAFAVTEWVFFGRLERRKGLAIFLDALARMPQEVRDRIQITFLGKAIVTPQFDSRIAIGEKLVGWRLLPKLIADYDRDQALDYLQQPGRVAIIASLVENSPYTVLECVLKRIPFIAADVGGIAELVYPDDRARALFKPTPAGLAATLLALDGASYSSPRPAVGAMQTQQCWLELQERLLQEVPAEQSEAMRAWPHITVCLVHYNRPALLAEALASLRAQTYDRFDVVLVDDGSPSSEAVDYLDSLQEEFATRGWTIIRQANAYLGAARNAAARHARGDYVLFMDDDNLAKPNELAVFATAARHSDADILTTVSDVFSETDNTQPPDNSRQLWIPLGNATGLGVFRNVFGDANALVRRSTFESLGGFTEDYGVGHEDWEFFAKASLAGVNLQLIPEPLFWYRVNGASMLRAGHSHVDHARSVRPYWEGLPDGVGPVLAYASHMHRHPVQHLVAQVAATTPAIPHGRLRTVITGLFEAHLRSRLVESVRTRGWRVTMVRTLRYIVPPRVKR